MRTVEAIVGVLCLFWPSEHLVWKGQALPDYDISLSSGPSSQNVSVNEEAVFSCQAFAFHGDLSFSFVKWFLNGSPLEEELAVPEKASLMIVNATTLKSTVRFQVVDSNAEILNNSNITCQGFYDNELEEHYKLTSFSEPALLRIQGILNSPEIINTSIQNGFVSLQWQEPFTFNGVDIDYYQFNVTWKASLGPSDVQTSNTTDQTKEMQWSFLEPYGGICNVYNMCVHAVSAAGMGHPDCVKNFNETKKPNKVSNEEIDVKVDFMPDANVISTYTFDQDYCLQRRAETTTLIPSFQNRPSLVYPTTPTPDSDQPITLVMKIPQSQSSEVDNVTIILTNSAGSTEFDPIVAEMSCVHRISFPDDQSVQCLFVQGCVASGCKVVIKCDQLSSVEQEPHTLNLMRKSDSLVSEGGPLPCENITNCTGNSFLAYAIYNNSTSHSEVPDVVQSEIPLNVCSTSTKTVSMYTSSLSAMMESQAISPTQSSIPKETKQKNMLIAILLTCIFVLILFVVMVPIISLSIVKCRRSYNKRKVSHAGQSPTSEMMEKLGPDKCELIAARRKSQNDENNEL